MKMMVSANPAMDTVIVSFSGALYVTACCEAEGITIVRAHGPQPNDTHTIHSNRMVRRVRVFRTRPTLCPGLRRLLSPSRN